MEGADRIADGLRGTAKALGDLSGGAAVGAGREDLRAAQGEGVGGAEASSDRLPLQIAQGADEGGWLHPIDDAITSTLAQDHLWKCTRGQPQYSDCRR